MAKSGADSNGSLLVQQATGVHTEIELDSMSDNEQPRRISNEEENKRREKQTGMVLCSDGSYRVIECECVFTLLSMNRC